jgi:hypothetical protein
VEYSDNSPWPAADGNGAYLHLKDHGLDNSVAENWEASSDVITAVDELSPDPEITLYPNPVHETLTVRTGSGISSICIYDLRGSILVTQEGNGNEVSVDMSGMMPGIYIVRIFTRIGSFPRRVIKE